MPEPLIVLADWKYFDKVSRLGLDHIVKTPLLILFQDSIDLYRMGASCPSDFRGMFQSNPNIPRLCHLPGHGHIR